METSISFKKYALRTTINDELQTMNLLYLLTWSVRLYTRQAVWYLLAGLMLFLTTLMALGLPTAALLLDAALALYFGPGGSWISKPPAAGLIFIVFLAGLAGGSFMLFAGTGAFLRACAQIAAGRREINLLGHADYMREEGMEFWKIGMAHLAAGVVGLTPGVGLALNPALAAAGLSGPMLALGAALGVLMQGPLWMAMPAQALWHKGSGRSLGMAWRAAMAQPLAAAVAYAALLVALLLPTSVLMFYPIYIFFIFMPWAALVALLYLEALKDQLQPQAPAAPARRTRAK